VGDRPTRILPLPGPFNFSRLCNEAAAAAQGKVLAFLNNDTVATESDWLARLSTWAMHAECGAVGPKLVYPSGRVQHGGIVIGLGGYAAHIESGAPNGEPGYGGRLDVTHEVSAVTGACLVVEKAKFDAVGGFDVGQFPVELGDVDLCLRLASRGWKSVLVPEVSLVHRESASRGRATDRLARYAWEHAHFTARWQSRMRDDPYYHPALSLTSLRTRLDG
jgi:GT2 family glycosyltransferase